MGKHTRRFAVNGEEVDAFGTWRHVLYWKPGERKAVKRRANRRERRDADREITEQRDG